MRRLTLGTWISGALLGAAPARASQELAYSAKSTRGPCVTHSFLEEWRDAQRARDVPALLRYPEGPGPFPVIVFSHGLGGTRWNYAYAGEHWASHGFVVVHLQHAGSDEAVWRESSRPLQALQAATRDLDTLVDRPLDVRFALDELERRSRRADWPLAGKLDFERVGVAGHSFGAYTALCAAGRDLVKPFGGRVVVRDARIRACVAMSPQGSERERRNGTWSTFECPVLHMTGTLDTSPITPDVGPTERRIPFEAIERAQQYLLVLEGAEHLAFGDSERRAASRRDPRHWPLILASSTAFFEAYLRGDTAALVWLREGGFERTLGPHDTFEAKLPSAKAR
ncbi:MAG: acetylhydrolase [Planctomycetes bacterium]|nr:acetylhydrolase [Planctomycetota bacterium]